MKVIYRPNQSKRILVPATAENVPTEKKIRPVMEKPNVCAHIKSVQLSFCIYVTWDNFSHRATGKAAKVLATWSLLIGYQDPRPQLTCSSVSHGWVDCKTLQLQPTVFRLVAAVREGEGLRDLRVCIPRLVTG